MAANNTLFDTINALFTDKAFIDNCTDETNRQNMFMVNRRLSIQYPIQCQVFNVKGIDPTNYMKFWSEYLYAGPNARIPKWVYTKGAAKAKPKEGKKFSDSLIDEYCRYYCVSRKDVDSCFVLLPDKITEDLNNFEKLLKDINE